MNRRIFLSSLAGAGSAGIAKGDNSRGPIIVEAGRRVDAPDAKAVRFPKQNVPNVRKKIRQLLLRTKPVATVSSAACGADLLLLEVAGEMRIPHYILLPSNPDDFRVSSVTDRPGNWGELYSKALSTSRVEVLKLPEGQEGYLETNRKLLDRAQTLAKEKSTIVNALVVWNRESRGPDDVTAHFLEQAKLRNMPIVEIATL